MNYLEDVLLNRKISKIMLFRYSDICHNLLNALNMFVIRELDIRGIKYEIVDASGSAEVFIRDIFDKLDDSYDAALAFNSSGIHNILDVDGESLFDKYNIHFYNWIVDHPISNLNYLSTKCSDYNMFCMDRQHVLFVKRFYPDIKKVSFLPLGGIPNDAGNKIPIKEREYDIAFPGGLMPLSLQETLDIFNKYPDPNREIILNLIDFMLNNRETDVVIAVETVLKDRFGITELDWKNRCAVLELADSANNFMRAFFREEVIRHLANSGLDFHIFGDGWKERIGYGYGYTVFHKGVDYLHSGDIFNRSKILLNVMPCFKDGTHDRIASGMLHNTLVVTDHSKFLDELQKDILCFYDINEVNCLSGQIKEMLANVADMQMISDRGFDYAEEKFTWSVTVDRMLCEMNE